MIKTFAIKEIRARSPSNHYEREVQDIEEQPHQDGDTPGAGMGEGVDQAVADVVEELEGRGENIPTVPPQIAANVDAKTADKQKQHSDTNDVLLFKPIF